MDDKSFESINVVPLVDIMLVLLTIVLTTASFISSGRIPVSLPQVTKADIEKRKDTIIEISGEGQIFLEGKAVSKDALEQQLSATTAQNGVLIRADRSIRFQSFVDVADVLKRLKITKVAVQTESARK
ncbi:MULTISPECIES: ExbD/TolR family protein [Methylosinus]|uniref:Biopolymer transporter ExbD n=1 Tax=Methylosinus trichosporium (strain ATCC 35070 / NCIMB 11131 / UNIQEM 75 / OB3b) TaxID=595536 RepID=A0A2D2CXG1_METT3|nr:MULTISPECIES: biopolymer transporter ExbD [Methylosinus]ATQ67394.1 biopolymer transporter ExbD [Methylosinus trichosporium OB3b]OBS51593.1 biopolymer transporter ExbD [Methylosinus sp. 3S-1]